MPLACLTQLDRSHRRHDDVMAQLLEAARRLAAGRPHDTDVDAVRDAVAYFSRAVTRHFLDEEGSVFPRLSTRRPELAEALASLSAEHPAQIALQNAVAETAKGLDSDDARQGAGKALLEVAERLAEQHRLHVAREDEIFAAAHEALTPQDDADIVAEMETRRDRDSDEGNGRIAGGGGGGGRGGGGGGGGGGRGMGRGGGGGGRTRSDTLASRPIAKAAEVAKNAVTSVVNAAAKAVVSRTKPAASKAATKKKTRAKKPSRSAKAQPAKSAARTAKATPSAKASSKKITKQTGKKPASKPAKKRR